MIKKYDIKLNIQQTIKYFESIWYIKSYVFLLKYVISNIRKINLLKFKMCIQTHFGFL
jgi:hypothetical protein